MTLFCLQVFRWRVQNPNAHLILHTHRHAHIFIEKCTITVQWELDRASAHPMLLNTWNSEKDCNNKANTKGINDQRLKLSRGGQGAQISLFPFILIPVPAPFHRFPASYLQYIILLFSHFLLFPTNLGVLLSALSSPARISARHLPPPSCFPPQFKAHCDVGNFYFFNVFNF